MLKGMAFLSSLMSRQVKVEKDGARAAVPGLIETVAGRIGESHSMVEVGDRRGFLLSTLVLTIGEGSAKPSKGLDCPASGSAKMSSAQSALRPDDDSPIPPGSKAIQHTNQVEVPKHNQV